MGKIQLRRASTAAQWLASSVVLDAGEPGVALDTGEVRFGNGTDIWANLPTRGSGGGTGDWNSIVNKPAVFPAILGTTATTAAAGNDPRLSDARTPLDNSVTNVKVPAGANISADKIADGTTNKVFTATLATKLANIAANATANSTDAALRDRATHTGVTPISGLTPGTSVKVIWDYTNSVWTFNGTAITARPGNRTDISIDFIGGTEANRPTWGNQPGDTQLVVA